MISLCTNAEGRTERHYPKQMRAGFVRISINLYVCHCILVTKQVSRKEKALIRLLSLPKDFRFEELIRVLGDLGFEMTHKGKTSGSRVKFYNREKKLQYLAHKPHPESIIKEKALKDIISFLKNNELI